MALTLSIGLSLKHGTHEHEHLITLIAEYFISNVQGVAAQLKVKLNVQCLNEDNGEDMI